MKVRGPVTMQKMNGECSKIFPNEVEFAMQQARYGSPSSGREKKAKCEKRKSNCGYASLAKENDGNEKLEVRAAGQTGI